MSNAPNATRRLTTILTRRIFVTLIALAVYWLGRRVPMPGLDIAALTGAAGLDSSDIYRFSIFLLGVTPLYAIRILLEIAMLLYPAMRQWEHSRQGLAAGLRAFAYIAALLMAALQADAIAGAFTHIQGAVPEPGLEVLLTGLA